MSSKALSKIIYLYPLLGNDVIERCREGKIVKIGILNYMHILHATIQYIAGVTYIPTHAVIHYITHVRVCM